MAAPLFDLGQTPGRAGKGAPKPMGEMPERRQINVMKSDDYKPTPFTPLRQGSLDFSAIVSRGVRC
ncbi:hypothetical protein [Comamonas sp. A7-5]|uniref:hypothetical protein n=1 Tax=Comamonas sp. A7-5 TaxID=673549 RepID=UPI0031D3D8FB